MLVRLQRCWGTNAHFGTIQSTTRCIASGRAAVTHDDLAGPGGRGLAGDLVPPTVFSCEVHEVGVATVPR